MTKRDAKTTDRLAQMRERYNRASDHWDTPYSEAVADIRFATVPGNQWDADLKARRRGRACYEFNKIRQHCLQVINEQRQTRPQGKVRGMEDADRGLAELMQGICRNIESTSNAERAYDIAHESAVYGGLGFWRVCTDYASDDDFELDIRIKPIRNFTAVKFDPAAIEIDRRDANFCFVEELIPKEQFEREHPKADLADFESSHDTSKWHDKGQIRRAEYWEKVPVNRDLWALSDGRVVFADELGESADLARALLGQLGVQIVRERVVAGHKVTMTLTNGREFLSEPYEFPCKFIPIVPVWGNVLNVEGEDYWCGLVRFGKDQQRLHNVHRVALIEAVAKSPKAPFIGKKKSIKGYEPMWQAANAEDFPFLFVADDATEIPQRAAQAEVPVALIQLAGMDNDDLKASTGIHDASLGARSNETSGRAITARKIQGATATFNYLDNLTYAIRYTYEILVDMIPRVYDTQRVVRVLGEDGAAKWKTLYQEVQDPETGETIVINDIRKGKYDVTVTVGPSFATQRMEAAAMFAEMAAQIGGAHPAVGPLMAWAVVKNQDGPGMEEVEAAMRKPLVAQGLLEPKEGEEPPAPQGPPPPDPIAQAKARELEASAGLKEAQAQRVVVETGGKHMQNAQQMQMQQTLRPGVSSHNDAMAIQNLRDAIALHERHMNGTAPTTGPAGEKSQQLMMDQMMEALRALVPEAPPPTGMDMGMSPQNEPPPKGGFFSPDGFPPG